MRTQESGLGLDLGGQGMDTHPVLWVSPFSKSKPYTVFSHSDLERTVESTKMRETALIPKQANLQLFP